MSPDFDPTSPLVSPVRRSGRRGLAIAAVAGTLLTVGVTGAVVGAADGTGSGGLRTAEVARHEVVETLDLTGTVAPVAQAAVSFPTAGTVASVAVAPGDRVAVGEVLATLDTADLADAIVAAEEAVALAELSLEQALSGDAVTGSPSGDGGGDGDGADGSASGSPSGMQPTAAGAGVSLADLVVVPVADETSTSADDPELAAAQQAVLDAARAADDALATAEGSLALAGDVCGALDQAGDDDGTVARQCQDALTQVLVDQQAARDALAALGAASDALDAILAARAEGQAETPTEEPTTPSTPASPSGAADDATGDDGTGGDGTGGAGTGGAPTGETDQSPSGDGSTASPSGAGAGGDASSGADGEEASAEALVAYQSDVDAAQGRLAVAQQSLDQATIVSPLAGTVASVGLVVGDEVTAASSTSSIVVVGDGGYEVTTTITVDDMADVEVGQRARVAVDGVAAPIEGEVVEVGLSATTGDSGRVYPVAVALSSSEELRNGTLAEVSVELDRTDDAVSVPTSAVDLSGSQATVEVLDEDGSTRSVPVTLGAVGGAYVAVEGVEVGEIVVIADLSEALPDSASDAPGENATFGGPGGGDTGRPQMDLSGAPPG